MTKKCKKCQNDFVLDKNDISFYEKMQVPTPVVCPICRFKMRALWRNETTLYSGKNCDLCGKKLVTMYNPKSPYKVYCHECYYSDKWDPKSYATGYDFDRPFLEQMKEFLIKVPKITTYLSFGYGPNQNSEYVNMAGGCKNCYLVFNTGPAEDTLYSRGVKDVRDCSDIYFATKIERCYESINIQESSSILWGKNISGSVDCAFVLNCRGVMNCFGCVNINNKSHYFLNQPMERDEYDKKVSNILGSHKKIEEFKEEFLKLCAQLPNRENNNIKSVDSTGDYLFQCKNVKDSFEVARGEDCRYLFSSKEIKDSYGTIGYGASCERMLEVVAVGHSNNIISCYGLEYGSSMLYCFYTNKCNDCVACDSLQNGKFSIFNKQYSKEEYKKIKNIIIEELKQKDLYGLMIPPELAPFAYNETIGQDNMPMTKDEALVQGFRWEDDIQKTEGKETIKSEDIPDNIKDITDAILNEVLVCVDCRRNYKITAQELLFYRKMNIPIPRKCFYCRHKDRIKKRGPYEFWQRNCDKCQKEITTNYSLENKAIVYCESCYQKEVY